jgi:hypothetical protein
MLIYKHHLIGIIIANFAFAILLNSLGNLIFAITTFFILMLWNTPDYFISFKRHLRNMSLYIGWIFLGFMLKITRGRKLISYKELIKKDNILKFEQISYLITYLVTFYVATIIYVITREYIYKYIIKILGLL